MEKTLFKQTVVSKPEKSFVDDAKNLLLSPIAHGIVGAVIFLSTMLVIKMFALRIVDDYNLLLGMKELVLTLFVGTFFFSMQLLTKIKLTKFYQKYRK